MKTVFFKKIVVLRFIIRLKDERKIFVAFIIRLAEVAGDLVNIKFFFHRLANTFYSNITKNA